MQVEGHAQLACQGMSAGMYMGLIRAMAWLIASACMCCSQVPGGERVPFLFTIKELQAKGNLARFGGAFKVPSYRGSSFLDPKVGFPGTSMMAVS